MRLLQYTYRNNSAPFLRMYFYPNFLLLKFLNVLTHNQFLRLSFSQMRFHSFPDYIVDKEVISICLYLMSLMCFIIWQCRRIFF